MKRRFQCLIKLYTIRHIEKLQWIVNCLQNLHKVHITTKSAERLEYFGTFTLAIEFLFKFLIFVYAVSLCVFFLNPVYMYYFENELVAVMPLYMPGIDENTTTGLTLVTIFHVYLLTVFLLGSLAAEYFFSVIIVSPLIFAKLISLEMDQIHIDLQENDTALFVNARFRNILQMHQEANE